MNKKAQQNLVTLGKLGTSHGVRGWIRVYSETDNPSSVFDYPAWQLYHPQRKDTQTAKVVEWKNHSNKLICKLEGIDNPEDAKLLTGRLIQISESELPELTNNQYYWSQLIGLELIDLEGKSLGIVDHLIETGSNDVMIVKGPKEHAVPYLPWVIKQVDLEAKKIFVDWEIL